MYFYFFSPHVPQSRPHLTLATLSKHKFVWENDTYFLFCAQMLIPQKGVYLFLHLRLSIRSNSVFSCILTLYFVISLPCMWGQRLDHYTTRLMELSEMLPNNHGGISEFCPFFSQRELNDSIMQISSLTFSSYV